jgi:hypothetical protein
MWLFFLTIPLMVVAIGAAAVPLLVASRREITQLAREAEMKVELHRRRHGMRTHGHATPHSPRPQSSPRRSTHHDRNAWYRPVLIERQ